MQNTFANVNQKYCTVYSILRYRKIFHAWHSIINVNHEYYTADPTVRFLKNRYTWHFTYSDHVVLVPNFQGIFTYFSRSTSTIHSNGERGSTRATGVSSNFMIPTLGVVPNRTIASWSRLSVIEISLFRLPWENTAPWMGREGWDRKGWDGKGWFEGKGRARSERTNFIVLRATGIELVRVIANWVLYWLDCGHLVRDLVDFAAKIHLPTGETKLVPASRHVYVFLFTPFNQHPSRCMKRNVHRDA